MNRIKEFRQSIGMTVKELSLASGVAVGYISDIENDNMNETNPTKLVMEKISSALGKTVPEIFYEGVKSCG
ncbi:helix-turn-helix transcriptional regulator [Clostridium pasteurianum]|uniref:Putative transcriptional regulator n=1 Tax=Clostridium pasteurianum BC1 TaxID=86416 RepID=R4K6L8_CLOPA|nr:helix-turn-helix transcriptional regulator [Clostridium pasteurianum]AGK98198.1 putative transcriptional regulator [Clostridium pasteurianum BC1]